MDIIKEAKHVLQKEAEAITSLLPRIDAQFEKANRVIKELSKTKEGREKIIKIYNIKNIDGYKNLLS